MRRRVGYNLANKLRNNTSLGLNMSSSVVALAISISFMYRKNIVYNYNSDSFLEPLSEKLGIGKQKIKNIIKAGIREGIFRKARGQYSETGFVIAAQYKYGKCKIEKGDEYFVPSYHFFKDMNFEQIISMVKSLPLMLYIVQRCYSIKNRSLPKLMNEDGCFLVEDPELFITYDLIEKITGMSSTTIYKSRRELEKIGVLKTCRNSECMKISKNDIESWSGGEKRYHSKCTDMGNGIFATSNNKMYKTKPNSFNLQFNGSNYGKPIQEKEHYSKYDSLPQSENEDDVELCNRQILEFEKSIKESVQLELEQNNRIVEDSWTHKDVPVHFGSGVKQVLKRRVIVEHNHTEDAW